MAGSGPAGEVTMDDVRQRLASITARLTAMRERDPISDAKGSGDGKPGHGVTEGATDGQRASHPD